MITISCKPRYLDRSTPRWRHIITYQCDRSYDECYSDSSVAAALLHPKTRLPSVKPRFCTVLVNLPFAFGAGGGVMCLKSWCVVLSRQGVKWYCIITIWWDFQCMFWLWNFIYKCFIDTSNIFNRLTLLIYLCRFYNIKSWWNYLLFHFYYFNIRKI